MIPLLDKQAIKTITKTIDPKQTKYCASINNICQDVEEKYPEIANEDKTDDVIFVSKIMAFADKFKNLHWAAVSVSYHNLLDDFGKELEEYKDDIAENIQSVIGQFDGSEFTKIELPLGNNPLVIINELKQCIVNWFELHQNDVEYEGCRNATSGMLQIIHKYIYLFRLCKINEE